MGEENVVLLGQQSLFDVGHVVGAKRWLHRRRIRRSVADKEQFDMSIIVNVGGEGRGEGRLVGGR